MASIQHIVDSHAITAAQTIATRGGPIALPADCAGLTAICDFTSGTGGTNAKAYVQTTLDGTNWTDIMAFAFTTSDAVKYLSVREDTAVTTDHVSTTGSLTDDTAVSGIIGDQVRVQIVTTGTYTGASMDVRLRIEYK